MRPLAPLLLVLGLAAGEADGVAERLLRLDRDERQAALEELFLRPTPVRWEAGSRSLGDAIRSLDGAGGNHLLLQLGVDERAVAELAAIDGSWWEGVLRCCDAYRLAVDGWDADGDAAAARSRRHWRHHHVEQERPLASGPVLLVPARADERIQASGAALLRIQDLAVTELRSLRGGDRWLDLRYRLRLEPRLPLGMVSGMTVRWRKAVDGDGIALVLPQRSGDGILAQAFETPRGDGAAGDWLRVSGLQPGSRSVTIDGGIDLTCQITVTADCKLRVGERSAATLGGVPLEIILAPPKDAGVAIEGDDRRTRLNASAGTVLVIDATTETSLGSLDAELRDADGTPLNAFHSSTSWRDKRLRATFAFNQELAGDYQLVITANEQLGEVSLPLRLEVELP